MTTQFPPTIQQHDPRLDRHHSLKEKTKMNNEQAEPPKPLDQMIKLWEGIAQLHYKAAQLGSGGSNPLPLTRALSIVTALKHYKIALENDR